MPHDDRRLDPKLLRILAENYRKRAETEAAYAKNFLETARDLEADAHLLELPLESFDNEVSPTLPVGEYRSHCAPQ